MEEWGGVSWASASSRAKTLEWRAPKHPYLPTQGNFVYFVLPYVLVLLPCGASRARCPELCSASGTQDGLGRGWTAQGAHEECQTKAPLQVTPVEPPALTACRA